MILLAAAHRAPANVAAAIRFDRTLVVQRVVPIAHEDQRREIEVSDPRQASHILYQRQNVSLNLGLGRTKGLRIWLVTLVSERTGQDAWCQANRCGKRPGGAPQKSSLGCRIENAETFGKGDLPPAAK